MIGVVHHRYNAFVVLLNLWETTKQKHYLIKEHVNEKKTNQVHQVADLVFTFIRDEVMG